MGRGLVLGVGVNDEKTRHGCPFYDRWKGMLRRCYGDRAYKSYAGCRVAEEWLRFSAFKRWMELQSWQGNHLDKDILRPDEKLYCPETSVFVPQFINTIMSDKPSGISGLPAGVVKTKRGKPYMAMIRTNVSEKTFLGVFDSPIDAHAAWASEKAKALRHAICLYEQTEKHDERICQALLRRAEQLDRDAAEIHSQQSSASA